jgi:hypothetical protein
MSKFDGFDGFDTVLRIFLPPIDMIHSPEGTWDKIHKKYQDLLPVVRSSLEEMLYPSGKTDTDAWPGFEKFESYPGLTFGKKAYLIIPSGGDFGVLNSIKTEKEDIVHAVAQQLSQLDMEITPDIIIEYLDKEFCKKSIGN